jgi:copper homeostasis protein
MRKMRGGGGILVEVCVESVEDAVAAAAGGAGRVELNAALPLDGLTPSHGMLAEARRRVRVPLVAMARPRAGGFDYSPAEFRVLQRDVEHLVDHGADGVAFGILTADRGVDAPRCRVLVRQVAAAGREAVFHRAFDAVTDPFDTLERLVDLGVRRVMTSGGRRTAADGADVIVRLLERAAGRIEILPAGGIRPANARRLIGRTGCDQLHTSVRDRTGRMNLRDLADLVRRTRHGPSQP